MRTTSKKFTEILGPIKQNSEMWEQLLEWNNFWLVAGGSNQISFIRPIKMQIGTNYLGTKTYKSKLKNTFCFIKDLWDLNGPSKRKCHQLKTKVNWTHHTKRSHISQIKGKSGGTNLGKLPPGHLLSFLPRDSFIIEFHHLKFFRAYSQSVYVETIYNHKYKLDIN